jgi:small-conductance mechanosensitive channel
MNSDDKFMITWCVIGTTLATGAGFAIGGLLQDIFSPIAAGFFCMIIARFRDMED